MSEVKVRNNERPDVLANWKCVCYMFYLAFIKYCCHLCISTAVVSKACACIHQEAKRYDEKWITHVYDKLQIIRTECLLCESTCREII